MTLFHCAVRSIDTADTAIILSEVCPLFEQNEAKDLLFEVFELL